MPDQLKGQTSLFGAANADNNVIDLDLSVTNKKRFRLNGDDSRILELNVSDMNIISRITESYPKLKALQDKASTMMDGVSGDEDADEETSMSELATVAERLKAVDTEMRELIDYMFDAPVSEICAPDGSMYDPFNGSFRFEIIINLLMGQYESNLQKEYAKMEKQLSKHTAKYKKG